MARLADGLGLRQELLLEDIDALSGGQRRRIDLMRVLFQEPDLMILDEPTNHLDRSAKRWLLDELARFGGALLVVSHDLRLLDQSITKVLHIANQRLTEWKGNYSKFEALREADQSQRERASELESREIKRLSSLADSMRASTEKRARKAKALDRRVERMEAGRTQVEKRERASRFSLPVPPRSGTVPLDVAKLGICYGSNEVLSEVTFHAGRGDHIVIIGRNGAGKSSLLRCLAGVQEPSNGVVELGANVEVGYFAQEHEQIDPDRSALENVSDAVLKAERDRRALLGSFGLPSKAADQLPGTLSGGERAKLGLAMLSAGEANLLLLDEPTNNLDPSSIAAVGAMLGRLAGHHRRREPRARLRRGAPTDLLPAPARGALHPLARRSTSTTWRCADLIPAGAAFVGDALRHPDLGRPEHALVEGDGLRALQRGRVGKVLHVGVGHEGPGVTGEPEVGDVLAQVLVDLLVGLDAVRLVAGRPPGHAATSGSGGRSCAPC